MDGGPKPEPHCPSAARRIFAIIGGGFSGAAIAIQLARHAQPSDRILVFEPRPQLGLGLAYSTQDPAHRLNARAARMSLLPDEPAHFTDWISATGACADDAEAALPDGRLFPRRAVFGRYVAASLAPLLRNRRVIHVRDIVEDLAWQDGAWVVRDAGGQAFRADVAVLATGHAPAAVPRVLAPLAGHPGFITAPLQPGPLQAVAKTADVLIIGTGLTMADCVTVLHRNGHTGRICAISRRGQMPQPHAEIEYPPFREFAETRGTARALLRLVRDALRQAQAAGLPWQSVFDGLRCDAEALWAALPAPERRRLLRHARPFWDTHRHRLPPPVGEVLRQRLADGSLTIQPAAIVAAAPAGPKISVALRPGRKGAEAVESYDAVVLTAGFGRIGESAGGVVAKLLAAGLATLDETGQGLACDAQSRSMGREAGLPLFVLGPPARGSFADITGVPEIVRQAAGIARRIAAGAVLLEESKRSLF
jgi:uncharacterized NAD(P)/FAD-binding protein YdhS